MWPKIWEWLVFRLRSYRQYSNKLLYVYVFTDCALMWSSSYHCSARHLLENKRCHDETCVSAGESQPQLEEQQQVTQPHIGGSTKWSCDPGLAHVIHNHVSLSGESQTSNKLDILSLAQHTVCSHSVSKERWGPFWPLPRHTFLHICDFPNTCLCWYSQYSALNASAHVYAPC